MPSYARLSTSPMLHKQVPNLTDLHFRWGNRGRSYSGGQGCRPAKGGTPTSRPRRWRGRGRHPPEADKEDAVPTALGQRVAWPPCGAGWNPRPTTTTVGNGSLPGKANLRRGPPDQPSPDSPSHIPTFLHTIPRSASDGRRTPSARRTTTEPTPALVSASSSSSPPRKRRGPLPGLWPGQQRSGRDPASPHTCPPSSHTREKRFATR